MCSLPPAWTPPFPSHLMSSHLVKPHSGSSFPAASSLCQGILCVSPQQSELLIQSSKSKGSVSPEAKAQLPHGWGSEPSTVPGS